MTWCLQDRVWGTDQRWRGRRSVMLSLRILEKEWPTPTCLLSRSVAGTFQLFVRFSEMKVCSLCCAQVCFLSLLYTFPSILTIHYSFSTVTVHIYPSACLQLFHPYTHSFVLPSPCFLLLPLLLLHHYTTPFYLFLGTSILTLSSTISLFPLLRTL